MVASELASRRFRGLLVGGMAAGCVVAALYAPFWFGFGTLASLVVQANRPQWSIGSLLLNLLSPWLGAETQAIVRAVLTLVCVVATLLILWRARTRQADARQLASQAVLVTSVGLLCLPLAFYSHYLSAVIALAAFAADSRIRWLVLALSFGAEINSVLGVGTFAGGLTGQVLDITGSCVIALTAAGGLWRARTAWLQPVRAA